MPKPTNQTISKPTKTSSQTPKAQKPPFLLKLTLILAKAAEIIHWVLAGAAILAAIISITNPNGFNDFLRTTSDDAIISCYGFNAAISQQLTPSEGPSEIIPNHAAITFFCFGCVVVLSLMAMIFRNVYLILKTSAGQTWFAHGDTPFQQNIVRMTREIGIFFIAISALSLLSVIIVGLSAEPGFVSLNYESAFIGLVFLCFSTFFAYGTKLQEDVDGLI